MKTIEELRHGPGRVQIDSDSFHTQALAAIRKISPLRPSCIQWNHTDGPMVSYPDGSMRWLSLRERFLCWIGWLKSIDIK